MERQIPEPFWVVYMARGDLKRRRVMRDPRTTARMRAVVKSIVGECS